MEFNELNLVELDRNLTPEERNEWQSIYASYMSQSVMTGTIAGVDYHEIKYIPTGEKEAVTELLRCAIIIPYRVKIIIPETEIFMVQSSSRGYILHSMGGATIDYVVTHIDRENDIALASRTKALELMRYKTNRTPLKDRIIEVRVVSVGKYICVVNYGGYDVLLQQRDVQYSMIPDLREVLRPGEIKRAKVKDFIPEEGKLSLSIKETMPHPFDGVDIRHPIGSTRQAVVVGKYRGGVFCRLHDNVTDVLCNYDTMHYDGDFQMGDRVEILIKKLNYEKKLVYGKMLRKMR